MENKDLVNKFGKPMQGQKVEDYNPLEKIPTVSATELEVGTTLCGKFVETQRLVSDKFKSPEKDPATGKSVQYRHVLEREEGECLGIWNCGELKLGFSKIQPGTYVELTYLGKEKVNGNDQHRFSWKTGDTAH